MSLTQILAFRSLRARPLRMLLSAFGIILGVAAILSIGITNQTALDAVTRLFQDTSGKTDLVVINADSDADGIDEDLLFKLEDYPGVQAAVPSLHLQSALAEGEPSSEIQLSFMGTSAGGLLLYGIDPQLDPQVRQYEMLKGEFLSKDLDGEEIVLSESLVKENELEIGKRVGIRTPNGLIHVRLVGVLAREGAGRLNNGAFGLLPLQTAQQYFDAEGQISQIDLALVEDLKSSQRLEQTRNEIQANLGERYSVIYPAEQGQRMSQMLTNYQIGLNFMSAMALFVGAFLIYNAFSMTVVERTREFGMLRTIGMTRAQVTGQVLTEALFLGISGSAAGLALGVLMARGLTRLMETLLAQEMSDVPVPIPTAILGAVIGILVTLLAALIPAYQAGRITPLEALMVRGRSKAGWLLRFGWIPGILLLIVSTVVLILNPFPDDPKFTLGSMVVFFLFTGAALVIPASTRFWESLFGPFIKLFYGNSGRLGSSNIQRSRLRTTLTVSALMISVAMVVIVWIITGSFKGDLENWLASYMGGDLFVSSSLPMSGRTIRQISTVEGVSESTPVRYFETEWRTPTGQSERITMMALDPASYVRVTTFQFSQPMVEPGEAIQKLANGDAVFISSVLSEKFGLKPGDSIVIKTKAGLRPFQVAAIVVNYYNQGQVININWTDMQEYFGYRDANAIMVKVEEGASIDQVAARIDQMYGEREQLVVESNQKLLDQISLLMRQAFSMFDVLALISIIVGFFGITNTLTMNVIERTQEIGMLRGVGMTRSQVNLMVMAEAGLMGIIGGIMGLVFGVVLARIFLLAMTAMSGYRLDFIVPFERLWQALLIAILVSQIAAFFPALRASRVRILDAIHYE